MRIAYLTSWAFPTAASANTIQMLHMCSAFAQDGHEVFVLGADRPERLRGVDPYAYYGARADIQIEHLRWPRVRGGRHIYGWAAARRARQLNADLVYGRFVPGCYFSARAGLATVLELHEESQVRTRGLDFLFARLGRLPSFKRLVVSSRLLADSTAIRARVPAALIRVAPNGGADAPDDGQRISLRRDRLHAGYVGSLLPGKGMELIARLAPRTPAIDFHIVGGPHSQVQYWSQMLRGNQNVILYGEIPPAETDKYRRSFDILLAPYQRLAAGDAAGGRPPIWLSPLKLIEYMAAAKPIVCSDLPAYRDLLEDGREALLCDPDDVEKWRAALECLSSEPALRGRLSQAARQRFLGEYTLLRRARYVLEGLS